MDIFESYYWNYQELPAPTRDEYFAILKAGKDEKALNEAVTHSLETADPALHGMLFDLISYRDSFQRWGVQNPFLNLRTAVHEKIIDYLKGENPPSHPAQQFPGAILASALGALIYFNEKDDWQIASRFIDGKFHEEVVFAALQSIHNLLVQWKTYPPELLARLAIPLRDPGFSQNNVLRTIMILKHYPAADVLSLFRETTFRQTPLVQGEIANAVLKMDLEAKNEFLNKLRQSWHRSNLSSTQKSFLKAFKKSGY